MKKSTEKKNIKKVKEKGGKRHNVVYGKEERKKKHE